MKIIVSLSLALLLFAGCAKKDEDENKKPEAETAPPKNTVSLTEEQQKQMDLKTEPVAPAQLSPEVKAYGRVVDPSALAAATGELATDQAANDASQAELQRLKILAAQNNASERALQAAEAAAARDQAQYDAARLKVLASWGEAIADRKDLPAFVQSLGKMENALVRADLPAGEILKSSPTGARLEVLSGETVPAAFFGAAPMVDPQTQGQGFLFLVESNSSSLAPGAAVTAYIQIQGEALSGFSIPRSAVIRHDGGTWAYFQSDTTNFVRRAISLEYPMENGWFVSKGVASDDKIVVTGAGSVFSEELSGGGFKTGRD